MLLRSLWIVPYNTLIIVREQVCMEMPIEIALSSYTFSSPVIPVKLGIGPLRSLFDSILEIFKKKCYK